MGGGEAGWGVVEGLGPVEGDLLDGAGGCGEVAGVLRGRTVAPGVGGIEVGEESGGEMRGEGFPVELSGELGGELLGHDEGDEDGVARLPESGGVVEDMELDGEGVAVEGAAAVGGDEGVDAAGVDLELVKFVGGEDGDGAIGGGAELEVALLAVVCDERGAEDLGELTGTVAAKSVHLEEAVGGGYVALAEEQVVEVGGVDRWDSLGVARDGDGSGDAGDGDVAIEQAQVLGEGRVHRVAEREGRGEDDEDGEQREDPGGAEKALEQDAPRRGRLVGVLVRAPVGKVEVGTSVGVVGCVFRVFGCGETHGLERF